MINDRSRTGPDAAKPDRVSPARLRLCPFALASGGDQCLMSRQTFWYAPQANTMKIIRKMIAAVPAA
jgi:hypothetical protein